ncbi:MAG: NIPSNAP family protein [Pirellulaceae bacterium]
MTHLLRKTLLGCGILSLILSFQTSQANAEEKGTRFFEIRTYTTHPGKLDALHARFRDHTNRIFKKHGMQLVGYWTPTDEALKNNTLVYILAYKDQAAREKAWAAFRNDPDWQEAFQASREDGPIVKKVDSKFLMPTDYSPIK